MAYVPIRSDRASLEAKMGDLGGANQLEDSDVESGRTNRDETTPLVRQWPRLRIPRPPRVRPNREAAGNGEVAPLVSSLIPWVINLVLAIALVSLTWKKDAGSTAPASHLPPTDLMWTMAQDQIQYRLEKTYSSQDSPQSEYQGWPSDESDRLWDEYDKGGALGIDEQTAARLAGPTEHVAVAGREHEYVAGLAVFHQLHCLGAVRRAMYPGRYNSSLLAADGASVDFARWNHIDHCIEELRRAITCHSDLAGLTYDWVEGSQLVLHPETLHTCRDFDRVREWAYARAVAPPMRAHVEAGEVVSYQGRPYGPEWDKVRTRKPEGWSYTKHDLWG